MGVEENSPFHQNAVFFIEVDKIKPNPYQPRREFDQNRLNELADSIRMYGVLQPLVVTRKEVIKEDGGLATEYELIAGERRLRASKIAGLREIPALIRATQDDEKTKLELAIIENLQREDLNAIDRARAFHQLAEEFGFKHNEIAKKIGRSREYVSNTIRMLALPEEIQNALVEGKISEGHARPLLMLCDRPEEQNVLFKEIVIKRMTVRDAEKISRKIAFDKVRKKERMFDPELVELEENARAVLGARVMIETREYGGKIEIDYVDDQDLRRILTALAQKTFENNLSQTESQSHAEMVEDFESTYQQLDSSNNTDYNDDGLSDEFPEDKKVSSEEDDEMYSVKNFSI
jgi:ParB family chromosome partitioning protein